MIQEEDPRGRMARRLKQLVVGERPANDMFKFVIRSGLQLDQAPWLAALKQLLDEFKPDVVILDPFSALHSGKENDGQEMSQIVKTIRASLVFRGITVIVVHHTRKDQKGASERADQATRGHSVLSAAADTLLTVKGLGQNTNQVRVSMLSKEEIETEAYIYRFEQSEPGGSIHLPYDGDAAEAKGRENMVKVVASVEALWQTGGADACSRKAIAERVGVSDNTVELGADIAWKAGRLQKGWVKPPSARNRMRAYIPPNVTANGSWEPWEESDSPSLDGFQAANGNGGSLALSDEQGHASYPPNPLPPQVLGAAVNTGEIGGEA